MDTAVADSRPTSSVLTHSHSRRRFSRSEAEAPVRTLIQWAGDDPDREGLKGTQNGAVRAHEGFFAGYREDPVALLATTFEAAATDDEMIVLRGIRKPEFGMVNSRMLRVFRDDPATRREFLSIIGSGRGLAHES